MKLIFRALHTQTIRQLPARYSQLTPYSLTSPGKAVQRPLRNYPVARLAHRQHNGARHGSES